MKLNAIRDRYETINKRDFRSALINLLESEYGILRSRKLIELLAEDVEDLHNEYYPHSDRVGYGEIVFRTTKDDGQGLDINAIISITGRSLKVVQQYVKLYNNFNPSKKPKK